MSPILVVLAAIVAIAGFVILIYNGLVMKRQRVNQAFADVDVQLKQRQNLIPNLVETVKGYASHEKETLDAVISARNAAQSASTPGEMSAAEGMLTASLGKLFALAEAYPDLKANQNMMQLSEELTSTENKVAFARQAYNDAVMKFNTAIESFPANIFAGGLGFRPSELFEVEAEYQRDAPEVKF